MKYVKILSLFTAVTFMCSGSVACDPESHAFSQFTQKYPVEFEQLFSVENLRAFRSHVNNYPNVFSTEGLEGVRNFVSDLKPEVSDQQLLLRADNQHLLMDLEYLAQDYEYLIQASIIQPISFPYYEPTFMLIFKTYFSDNLDPENPMPNRYQRQLNALDVIMCETNGFFKGLSECLSGNKGRSTASLEATVVMLARFHSFCEKYRDLIVLLEKERKSFLALLNQLFIVTPKELGFRSACDQFPDLILEYKNAVELSKVKKNTSFLDKRKAYKEKKK